MKKTIPFKKKLTFKTNINEITSISLENTLHNNNKTVEGDLIISGTYKITDTSIQVDNFEFKIPINIDINEKYDTKNIIIDITDFYYEIINNNILEVNIEILLDNIVEDTTLETIKEPQENIIIEQEENRKPDKNEISNERCIEDEEKYEIINAAENQKINKSTEISNILDNFSDEIAEYSTYYIYIIREGDTVDTILTKYNTTKEKLEEYNDLSEIKIGDKIIIPENNNAGN